MKKIIVFFLFVGLLAGCHDAYTPEPPPAFVGKVSANIDGKYYETSDLILLQYFPDSNTLLFATKIDDKYLSFMIRNVEAPVLKTVHFMASDQSDDGFHVQYGKEKGIFPTKGEWRLESKEGRHVKARFWAENANTDQTKTIVIEGGTIDIILPGRHYSRY